jgi:hypothetical protein
MKIFSFVTALLAGSALAGTAQAAKVAALVGDDTIAVVDTETKKVTSSWKVLGTSGRLVGIDVRPSDGMLYGVTADGTIWTIDTSSGKATQKSKLDMPLPSGGVTVVDFNPAADRLRIIGADGTNLRVNVDDGKVTKDGDLKFAEGDMNKGATPNVLAGAYTNSTKGAKETTLYNINAMGALVRQAPPNEGVLNTVGMLGAKPQEAAFDIAADGQGGNIGWAMIGEMLYRVDTQSGKASETAKISGLSGAARDIAILPTM